MEGILQNVCTSIKTALGAGGRREQQAIDFIESDPAGGRRKLQATNIIEIILHGEGVNL